MSYADEMKAEVNAAIELADKNSKAMVAYIDSLDTLRGALISSYVGSANEKGREALDIIAESRERALWISSMGNHVRQLLEQWRDVL